MRQFQGTLNFLTQDQAEHFLEKGYVVVPGAFSRELAAEWVDFAFQRLGYDPKNPATWEPDRIHLPSMKAADSKEVAPAAWAAICDLLGGQERIAGESFHLRDGFIINFHIGADRPWEPPSAAVRGWHKDGDFFRHFLDSPEQGLLSIVLWTDILPQSGGTFVACDSVKHVAQFLLEHPEGLLPSAGFGKLADKCADFVELTGEAGDVVLLHPFILHSHSQNPSGRPRFITNPPVHLKEPMNFDRENPADYSLVEAAVLRAFDAERLDYHPTAERERIVPERVRIQQKMLEEQKARLGIAS